MSQKNPYKNHGDLVEKWCKIFETQGFSVIREYEVHRPKTIGRYDIFRVDILAVKGDKKLAIEVGYIHNFCKTVELFQLGFIFVHIPFEDSPHYTQDPEWLKWLNYNLEDRLVLDSITEFDWTDNRNTVID